MSRPVRSNSTTLGYLIAALVLLSPAAGEAQSLLVDAGAYPKSALKLGLEAQQQSGPRFSAGISFAFADPSGELKTFFDQGFGGQLQGGLGIAAEGRLRLRGDLGYLVYGHEKREFCAPVPVGCRIGLGLQTNNTILYGGIGPEFVLMTERLEPYLYGTMGFSYFATVSSLYGADGKEDKGFDTTNYSDGVMAWKMGGGVRIGLSRGEYPLSLDLGLERHQNGITNFLTKGDIVDHPDGKITLLPNQSEANLMTFRFGVSLGLGTR
jgi:hypothetical protein